MKNKLLSFFAMLALYFGFAPNDAYAAEDMFNLVLEVVNQFLAWFAVLVAVIASALVFRNSLKMKGGVFGKALTFFGCGMVVVLAGFVATLIVPDNYIALRARDFSFIFGYIFMVAGAMKLLKVINFN